MRRITVVAFAGLLAVACGGGNTPSDGSSGMDGGTQQDVFIIEEDGAITRPDIVTPPSDAEVTQVRGTWRVVSSGTTEDISTIWGTAPNNIFGGSSRGVLRYNGTSWTNRMVDYTLYGASGSGPNDVWVIGLTIPPNGSAESGRPVFERFNGSAYMMVPNNMLAGPFNRVGAAAPNFALAVGQGAPARWDGTRWALVGAGVPATTVLNGVWVHSPTFAVAVGTSTLFWNGTMWTPQPSMGNESYIGVWGFSPTDVWIVGIMGFIQHFDGAWRDSDPGLDTNLNGVWGAASNDMWAVGDGGLIIHWNGQAWSRVMNPATRRLLAVWGTSANDIWASGEYGTLLHYTVP